MVRLETQKDLQQQIFNRDLHSSMVRLETYEQQQNIRANTLIYIPVWLD